MLNFFDLIKAKDIRNIEIIGISCGYVLNQLLTCPGASGYIDGIYYPYAKEHTMNFVPLEHQDNELKFVSKEIVHHILTGTANNALVITAALPTNRPRRGENHAYIGCKIGNNFEIYHLSLQKESDEDVPNNYFLRLAYDNVISMISLELFLKEKLGYSENNYVTELKRVY